MTRDKENNNLEFKNDSGLFNIFKEELRKLNDLKNGIFLQTRQNAAYALKQFKNCFTPRTSDNFKTLGKIALGALVATNTFNHGVVRNASIQKSLEEKEHNLPKNTYSFKPNSVKNYNSSNANQIIIIQENIPVNVEPLKRTITVDKNLFIIAVIGSGVTQELLDSDSRVIADPIDIDKENNGHETLVTKVILEQLDKYPEISKNIKVLNISSQEYSTERVMEAFKFAVDSGAKVINCSFGQNGINEFEYSRMKELFDLARQKNIVVVASAGNDGHNYPENYPAAFPSVISVGAVDKENKPAEFSSYNDSIDFTDDGKDVVLKNTKELIDGTSFSGPIVTAIMGLKRNKEELKGNTVSVDQLKATAAQNTIDLEEKGWDVQTGWGKIDAKKFLNAALEPSIDIEHPNVVMFRANKMPNNKLYVEFKVDDLGKIDNKNAFITVTGKTFDGVKIKEIPVKLFNADGLYRSVLSNMPDGTYTFNVSGFKDESGNILKNSKRFNIIDGKPVDLSVNYKIQESDNGIDNEAIFNIKATDNNSISGVQLNYGNKFNYVYGSPLFGEKSYTKNITSDAVIRSQMLKEGSNLIEIMASDGINSSLSTFDVEVTGGKIVNVCELNQNIWTLENSNTN